MALCVDCGNDYLRTNTRQNRCPTCQYIKRLRDRHSVKTRPTHNVPGDRHITRDRRNAHVFRAIDGEGIGDKYLLLGISDDKRIEWPDGLSDITDVFRFLYDDFLDGHQDDIYVGFFLTYDWNNWLRYLPFDRARYLLDSEAVAKRRRKVGPNPRPFPVEYNGWEFDILWKKRFTLRPKGKGNKWMFICDAGPFFQTSLLKALRNRSADCGITDEEVAVIEQGKALRGVAGLDDDMRKYNALENRALERLMDDIDRSIGHLGMRLTKTQYHGPGQVAQQWILKQKEAEKSRRKVMQMSQEMFDMIQASYYGGIFEILCHGHLPGLTYEYDINSAYPYQIMNLPCLCGRWRIYKNTKVTDYAYPNGMTLMHVKFWGKTDELGPVPLRVADRSSVIRPVRGSGWYWYHELKAAVKAGLIDRWVLDKELVYEGCPHPNPLSGIADLYNERLKVGKETSLGKGCKLIYNSVYGKFAQSLGNPKVSNAVYASLITSGCRSMILDAIARHPYGVKSLVMIATDAVYFRHPFPDGTLPISDALGEWSTDTKTNLTLFKPGMYWDDHTREAIQEGKPPPIKSRGISGVALAAQISKVDAEFATWKPANFFESGLRDFPVIEVPLKFTQASARQIMAQMRPYTKRSWDENAAYWAEKCGEIREDVPIVQSSTPGAKRTANVMWSDFIQGFRSWTPRGNPDVESTPYDSAFGFMESEENSWVTPDGPATMLGAEVLDLT